MAGRRRAIRQTLFRSASECAPGTRWKLSLPMTTLAPASAHPGVPCSKEPSGASVYAAARALATGRARYADVPGADIRLYAAPVVSGGQRVGTVVTGVSLAPYEQTRRLALIASRRSQAM